MRRYGSWGVVRKTNEQGYGGSRVWGGISVWFWYINIDSQDHSIVQKVLPSKCAELLAYVSCLLLSLPSWPWKGRFSQSHAPLRFPWALEGWADLCNIKVSGLTSNAWPLRLKLVCQCVPKVSMCRVWEVHQQDGHRPSFWDDWTMFALRPAVVARAPWHAGRSTGALEGWVSHGGPQSHFWPTWLNETTALDGTQVRMLHIKFGGRAASMENDGKYNVAACVRVSFVEPFLARRAGKRACRYWDCEHNVQPEKAGITPQGFYSKT